MGNSASSSSRGHQDDTVDFGRLTPQGVYTGPKDWNNAIVTQLIIERRLAPFYRPLEEYEETWDDDQILAAMKSPPEAESGHSESSSVRHEPSHANGSKGSHGKRPALAKEVVRCPEAAIYRGAVECPICFLYYPPNINHSRCCDQAICTECFVQIKRAEPTTTHIVSEPAACPYCVQDNFGVVYTHPTWRTGIGSDGSTSPQWPDSPKGSQQQMDLQPRPTHKRRQKSFGHDSPEVVTTDRIRPDWEAKLDAVRAAVTRRANRRIIMRQVGDRLIPVGVTSGRVHAISPEEAAQSENIEQQGGSRRSRRQRNQNQDLNQLLGTMGLGGQDLEELMMMEAMRLSLQEHEEHQRREAANREQSSSNAEDAPPNEGALPIALPPGQQTPPESRTPNPNESTAFSSPPGAPGSAPSTTTYSNSTLHVGTHLRNRSLTPVALTRKRTPSPTSTGPSEILQPASESSRWRRRSSSPRPFSTIAAAMSATTTATAILGRGDGSSEFSNGLPGNSTPTAASFRAESSPTNGTVSTADNLPSAAVAIPSPNSTDTESIAAKPIRPTMLIPTDSYASSVFSTESAGQTASTYDVLGSSPDSDFSREPLLASSPDTPTLPESIDSVPEAASSRVGQGAHE